MLPFFTSLGKDIDVKSSSTFLQFFFFVHIQLQKINHDLTYVLVVSFILDMSIMVMLLNPNSKSCPIFGLLDRWEPLAWIEP